ncbi:hypothetical protein C7M84_008433 [Penaeus vannamei]|uniref:Uncharacterized protein n=1 Tax=Penaeus vannamei TaxID=6689 RepID=A0A3R7QAS9_PENVA|nr:hypothetical protein C7M84_008433 [Penaeus vannamei]
MPAEDVCAPGSIGDKKRSHANEAPFLGRACDCFPYHEPSFSPPSSTSPSFPLPLYRFPSLSPASPTALPSLLSNPFFAPSLLPSPSLPISHFRLLPPSSSLSPSFDLPSVLPPLYSLPSLALLLPLLLTPYLPSLSPSLYTASPSSLLAPLPISLSSSLLTAPSSFFSSSLYSPFPSFVSPSLLTFFLLPLLLYSPFLPFPFSNSPFPSSPALFSTAPCHFALLSLTRSSLPSSPLFFTCPYLLSSLLSTRLPSLTLSITPCPFPSSPSLLYSPSFASPPLLLAFILLSLPLFPRTLPRPSVLSALLNLLSTLPSYSLPSLLCFLALPSSPSLVRPSIPLLLSIRPSIRSLDSLLGHVLPFIPFSSRPFLAFSPPHLSPSPPPCLLAIFIPSSSSSNSPFILSLLFACPFAPLLFSRFSFASSHPSPSSFSPPLPTRPPSFSPLFSPFLHSSLLLPSSSLHSLLSPSCLPCSLYSPRFLSSLPLFYLLSFILSYSPFFPSLSPFLFAASSSSL